jgi:CO/xanthine dehydrogenase FAD-binding subunit
LAEAAATVGAWQIQSRATLGGNIANASPAGDSLPALLALEAVLVVAGAGGMRRVPYAEMHTGYRQTALNPGEIIVRVQIPAPIVHTEQFFEKVGTREAQAISKLVLAFVAQVVDGQMTGVRVAAGSIAATPVRLSASEEFLEGKFAGMACADEVARVARGEVTPIDDVRSTSEYRLFVLGTVLRRMVLKCARKS